MTDSLPLVSIITPAYNRASYLDETIKSVLEQDYPHMEYIVLDDGSTDNSREVLEKYNERIIWRSHPNMGEARTVNRGFGMAHGEILAVVNSDDPLLPGAVSEAVSFMARRPDILVAYPDWNSIGPDSRLIRHVQVWDYDYLRMLRGWNCIVGPGAFIRRRAIELGGMRDPEFRYSGDFEFWLRLGLFGEMARIPKTLAAHRVHPESTQVSQRGVAMASEQIRLARAFYSRPNLPPGVLNVRAEAFSWAYAVAASNCRPPSSKALVMLIRSALCHPPSLLGKWYLALSAILPIPVYELLGRARRKGQSVSGMGCRV